MKKPRTKSKKEPKDEAEEEKALFTNPRFPFFLDPFQISKKILGFPWGLLEYNSTPLDKRNERSK